jgi:pentose-5-phosphate-3-epimerase
MVQAGAQVLVAGSSSLFDGKGGLVENLRRLRTLIGSE